MFGTKVARWRAEPEGGDEDGYQQVGRKHIVSSDR